ncbi:MAG: nucleoside phosphorylase [Candidatus Liptonbacteria bacterium]|nr:nucleoside phosphorylase [Candidatus Liptonbacteria bacterium]MBI3114590.1 nucleoside phosphorylase [Candidatus Harrisonbacteria bacterium]
MLLSHLKIKSSLVAPYVLLPGDPARVDTIGRALTSFRIIGNNREFKTGNGLYRGIPVTVCSTGIGCPSTAIAAEELIAAGAKVLIRVGTCGGAWRADVPAGSLVIPIASIRDEGTTREYIPEGFPAVADFAVVNALEGAAKESKKKYAIGINRTHDAFYGNQSSIVKWGAYLRDQRWNTQETPILSSEMESAALFIVASLWGARAGAILAVNANPEPLRARVRGMQQRVTTESDPKVSARVVEDMIAVALRAIALLAKQSHHASPL